MLHVYDKVELTSTYKILKYRQSISQSLHNQSTEKVQDSSASTGGIAPPFLTSALDGGEWSALRPGSALPPGNEPPVPIR
jgi:hypothetical protein